MGTKGCKSTKSVAQNPAIMAIQKLLEPCSMNNAFVMYFVWGPRRKSIKTSSKKNHIRFMKQLYQRINEEVDKVESAIHKHKRQYKCTWLTFYTWCSRWTNNTLFTWRTWCGTLDVLDTHQIHPIHPINRIRQIHVYVCPQTSLLFGRCFNTVHCSCYQLSRVDDKKAETLAEAAQLRISPGSVGDLHCFRPDCCFSRDGALSLAVPH